MTIGFEETLFLILRSAMLRSNRAAQTLSLFITTIVVELVPEHAPPHVMKDEPGAGVAVRVTDVPSG
jgi:hypothetical protein